MNRKSIFSDYQFIAAGKCDSCIGRIVLQDQYCTIQFQRWKKVLQEILALYQLLVRKNLGKRDFTLTPSLFYITHLFEIYNFSPQQFLNNLTYFPSIASGMQFVTYFRTGKSELKGLEMSLILGHKSLSDLDVTKRSTAIIKLKMTLRICKSRCE